MAVVDYQDSNATTRGLSNQKGENNCFINSVIQVLWHLDIFRDHFGQLQDHVCHELECVFCTLKELFVNFQYSESITLPPNFVRKAMADCYRGTGRFQLSQMDYAVECYEAVLKQLHAQITGTDWDTTCTHDKCLPHKIFSYVSCQIDECECGATSEPFPSEDILFYISADNLLKVVKKSHFSHKEILKNGNAFGKLLRECLTTDKKHTCPEAQDSNCKKSAQIQTMLLRSPYTINLSLSWSSDTSTKERVVDVLKSVGHIINVKEMFSQCLDETADSKQYHLSGIINYYGHHFSAFVYNTHLAKWAFCDDASFREVGDNWDDVIQLVKRAKYQPELLVYSTRGVDIWKEEKKRKPPQVPPKPNLARSSLLISQQNTANSVPVIDSPKPPFPGSYPQTPILPPQGAWTTNGPRMMTSPLLPQSPIVPSAPPPNEPDRTNREIKYPPGYQKGIKQRKISSQTPNKHNPVILLDIKKKQDTATLVTAQPHRNSNTNNSNQTTDLLLDYVSLAPSSFPEFEPVEAPDIASAPNLLLDVDNTTDMGSANKIAKRDVTGNNKTEEQDLIDFTIIPPVKPDDVYKEFFP